MSGDAPARNVEELLAEARALPRPSPGKIAILEEAVQLCDAAGDEATAFRVRGTITDEVYYTGDWDRFFVHFAWMLAQSDKEPEQFAVESLLWKYKWIINNICSVPTIPIARIEELLVDFETRFRNAGSTMRPVHQHRMYVASSLGRDDDARIHFEAWWSTPRDWLSDCFACERDAKATAYADFGEPDRALEEWLSLISEGKRCYHVPDNCRGRMLLRLWQRGEIETAMHHHRAGIARLKTKQGVAAALARHVAFMAAMEETRAATNLLTSTLAEGLAMPLPGDRLAFMTIVNYAVSRLVQLGVESLAIPRNAVPETVGKSAAAFGAWLDGEARSIASAFDARNGNDHQTRLYEEYSLSWQNEAG